jgi:hypothetical protein
VDDRSQLIAPCGIDCGICELYLCQDDNQMMDNLVLKGIPRSLLPCGGCREIRGRCPAIGGRCATFVCAMERWVSFCSDCEDFPCRKLAPAADRAGTLPHNMKLFNLCMIQQHGVSELVKRSAGVKKSYFQGRVAIGEGPLLAVPGGANEQDVH